MTNCTVNIRVNGTDVEDTIPKRMLLIDFIRERARMTGAHVGCTFEGVCGACTVHFNGEAVKSCLMLAVQADGCDITTVEGLAEPSSLTALQQAFIENHALQCGYCTPGMLMNATEFLKINPNPTEQEVRHALLGNICRCTGYVNIVKAVMAAAAATRDRVMEMPKHV